MAEVCAAHGKFAGTVCSAANARELWDMGYQFLSMGADVVALTAYFGQAFRDLTSAVGAAGQEGEADGAEHSGDRVL